MAKPKKQEKPKQARAVLARRTWRPEGSKSTFEEHVFLVCDEGVGLLPSGLVLL
jgi:hypothetical protein